MGIDVFSGQHSSDEHGVHEPIEFNLVPITHPMQLFQSGEHKWQFSPILPLPVFPSPQQSFGPHKTHVPKTSLYPDSQLEQSFLSGVHE